MKGLFFVLGVGALFAVGFTFRDLKRGHAPDMHAVRELVGASGPSRPEQILDHSFNLIKSTYYRPAKATPLRYAAITGMVGSLGDPHTVFLPPKEKQDFEFTTTAKFVGIGCALDPDPLGVRLSDVFDDSPAMKSGLKPGDLIIAVEGASIAGKAREAVVSRIRGEDGTIVHLTVLKVGQKTPTIVAVKRAKVFTPTVTSRFFPDSKVGYLAISTFSEPTTEQFDAKLAQLQDKQISGLVIDLRNDPGGLLETAVNLLARFVEDKLVVRMKHRDGPDDTASTPSGYKVDLHVPIMVLINEDSASASEIFAGCMRDYGIATLVGTHSYGKSSVQNIFPMIDGAGVKVTIARYYLPSTPYYGRKVNADGEYISGGLIPDVIVKQDPNVEVLAGKPETDQQLSKAIELIKAKHP